MTTPTDGKIEFHAKAGVFVQSQAPVTLADLDRAFNLYTPFIGATGYALYHLLVNEVPYNTQLSHREDHNFVLDSLNMSLPDFVKVRRRLEAVGLIKTYFIEDSLGEIYTYQMFPPLDATAFFQEQLLAGLLFKFVGEDRFVTLQKRYGHHGQPVIKGDNISAHFLQVFKPTTNSVLPSMPASETPTLPEAKDTFDFDGFAQLVRGTTVSQLAKHHDFIVAIHVIYGLNETTLAGYVTQAMTLDTHDLDERRLQEMLHSRRAAKKPDMTDINTAHAVATTTKRSQEMLQLIRDAQTLAPNAFIEDIKFKKGGGFVTRNEYYFINKMIRDIRLKAEVVNMLVWYELVKRNRDTVNVDTAETIANSWLQLKVDSAENALDAIDKYQPAVKTNNPRATKRQNKRIEPKLASGSETTTPQKSEQDVAAALAKLKNIKTKN